jgi:hypothetical protein
VETQKQSNLRATHATEAGETYEIAEALAAARGDLLSKAPWKSAP